MTYDNTDAQSQPSHHPTTPAKNRVTDAYKNAFWFGVARWAFSIVVLALCAMQLRDESALTYAPYVAALIYNVACASIHLLLPGPPVSPISRQNPKPPAWYTVILGLSLLAWIPAFTLLFVMTKDHRSGNYGDIALDKRASKSRHGMTWQGSNAPFTQTLTAAVFGVAITIFNLGQAFYVLKLHKSNFSDAEMADAHRNVATSWWGFGGCLSRTRN